MNFVDLITLGAFLFALLIGLGLKVVSDLLERRVSARLRSRLKEGGEQGRGEARQKVRDHLERAQSEARRRRRRQTMGWFGYHLNRFDTIKGRRGGQLLVALMLACAVLASAAILLELLPGAWWSWSLALVGLPLLSGLAYYRRLQTRFRERFLSQLPEAIDTIVRASQAGVPVAESIRDIGHHVTYPLGPEFRKIGDSLLLGNDLQEVLDIAVLRIGIPDFTFLTVCLSLQRGTGGSLAEALSNLAEVVRSRRNLHLKARAMTAEGRLTGTILSALPFVICAMLFVVNPAYVNVLFVTDTGRSLLGVAAAMLVLGILSIRSLAKLKV